MRNKPDDFSVIIDFLNGQVKRAIDGYDVLRQTIDAVKIVQSAQQEQISSMKNEINDLKQQLKDAKDEILKNQQETYKRIIYVQGSILLLILTAVIGLLIKTFFH